ncbi:MAG: potassium/proton antiporter [Paludibacteraceae bacterium]|nr:potassium/proton antiporter [Paludibacteraceae bacterium]
MELAVEFYFLVASVLLILSIVAGKTGYRFGVPALLLFLLIGILAGSDGLGIEFNSPKQAQLVGVVALNIILFSGGMDTRFSEIKPVLWQGIILSTFGVLLTAFITGSFIYWLTNHLFTAITFSFLESMLLGSIMSSTDSASVFSILRSKKLAIKHNLRPLLELESGSNDPIAYLLMIIFIQLLQSSDISSGEVVAFFFRQFIIGAICGYILSKMVIFIINRIRLDYEGLYSVLLLSFLFFLYSFTSILGGNGYLAVYIGGLFIGNQRFVHKKSSLKFFDGLTWLFQIIMFLTLGLLVNPHELLPIAGAGILIGLSMIVISRPISVFILLSPFRKINFKSKLFVSWVGLRGAVPIIFATYPLMSGIPQARMMFNIVFFITILSLVLQGSTIPFVARLLKLSMPSKDKPKLKEFDIDLPEDIKSAISEITVTEEMLQKGRKLMDITLPDQTLAVMIKRNDHFFVPRGNTKLEIGDTVLLIADNDEIMKETFKKLGVDKEF